MTARESSSERGDLRVLRRLLGLAATQRSAIALAALAILIAGGSVLALGRGLAWLIDRGLAAGVAATLDLALLGLLATILVLAGATFLRAWLVASLGERIAATLRDDVFANVLRQSPAFFETTRVGEVVSRIIGDASLLQSILGSSFSMALRNVVLVAGGLAMMIATSAKLTLVALLAVPVAVVPILIFGRRVRAMSRASQDRLADLGADIEETIGAVRVVQAFGREAYERRGFAEILARSVATAELRNRARAALAASVIVLVFSAIGLVLWIGGHDAITGRLSAGELSAFVFFAVLVAGSAGSLGEFVGDLQRAAGAAERLFALRDAAPTITAPAIVQTLPIPPRGALAFENVTFRYPARPERAALLDFETRIAPGETVAIVGPSGAGKSTLFALALRFYDPSSGTIRFDGIDIARCDPAALRARIALVPQEPAIFAGDVATNIRYGHLDADDAAIRAAAEAAQAAEFIDRLPQGMATSLGERGHRLSAGQRQRLAIARAILRDPALLLLDEATSALDAESERAVQHALDRLLGTRTTLVIAHRLATVRRADRILVLDQGRLVEEGAHDALVARGGLYARLAALQFSDPSA
jgi:ATP-binding cassette subfamily B protein